MLIETVEWVISCKKALNWFIESMGVEEWTKRREGVIKYFNSVKKTIYDEGTVQTTEINKLFYPIAVYDDWISWYMYLIESLVDRPTCDDPTQSARIYPFFITIGRGVEELKKMPGIDKRIKSLLNEKQNKPDSTLFELVVALCYNKNGWIVRFLEEQAGKKTPDFEVSRSGKEYQVECKRLAKVNDYSESERTEWQKRFKYLSNAMRGFKRPIYAEIVFKVPLAKTTEDILARVFIEYIKSGRLKESSVLSVDELDFKATLLDMGRISKRLSESPVRANSPQLIEVFTGHYDPQGSYTQLMSPAKIVTVGMDDGMHILNDFVEEIHEIYLAKWECISEESIDGKAKDIKKTLSKAVSQISDDKEGIIHIGYETVNGPFVEFKRHEKIKEVIQFFDYSPKKIESIYCNAIQPLVKIDEWECAETVIYFEHEGNSILTEKLLLDPPGLETRDATHWAEDIQNRS